MADNGSQQDTTWPMPKFRFDVDLGDNLNNVAFQDVSGLEAETQIIDYRHGNDPQFSSIKMPGIAKYGNVTLKRGVFVNDNNFWNWYSEIQMNTVKRRTVTIRLLDEMGKTTTSWTLKNAWPTKIKSTDLKSDGNEIAIDTIELAHEHLTISNG